MTVALEEQNGKAKNWRHTWLENSTRVFLKPGNGRLENILFMVAERNTPRIRGGSFFDVKPLRRET